MKKLLLGSAVLWAAWACGSSHEVSDGKTANSSTTSTVQGLVAPQSFPARVMAIESVSEQGTKLRSAVAADGSFKLSLPTNHRYSLQVVLASSTEPVVFPRAGRLTTTFHVGGGAAVVSLGALHHYAKAPTAGFKSAATSDSGDGDGECENGVLKGSEEPCVDEGGDMTCAEEDHDNAGSDGECENGKDATTGKACTDDDHVQETGDDHADGECENGKDTTTGAACTDPPDGADTSDNQSDGECENGKDENGAACVDEDADPNAPMAVPEHNAPDEIDGCD